jgi:hypothetical protein
MQRQHFVEHEENVASLRYYQKQQTMIRMVWGHQLETFRVQVDHVVQETYLLQQQMLAKESAQRKLDQVRLEMCEKLLVGQISAVHASIFHGCILSMWGWIYNCLCGVLLLLLLLSGVSCRVPHTRTCTHALKYTNTRTPAHDRAARHGRCGKMPGSKKEGTRIKQQS